MNINKSFMLNYVKSKLNYFIDKNNWKGWKVEVIKDGFKLINISTQQYATWNIHDYDEDFEVVQSKIMKFLDWNNQH